MAKRSARYIFILFFLSWEISGFAHGDIHIAIKQVTQEIQMAPDSAILYFNRGQLYKSDGDFEHSKLDFEYALELDESLDRVDFELAKLYLEHGDPNYALEHIDLFLKHYPKHGVARFTRSLILSAEEKNSAALDEMKIAISDMEAPESEHFLLAAQTELVIDSNRIDEALGWFQEGEKILGRSIVLAEKYIDKSMKYQKWELAMSKVEEVLSYFPRKEKWLLKKAQIYALSGQKELAKNFYVQTINTIQQLPQKFRNTPAMLYLMAEAIGGRDQI